MELSEDRQQRNYLSWWNGLGKLCGSREGVTEAPFWEAARVIVLQLL